MIENISVINIGKERERELSSNDEKVLLRKSVSNDFSVCLLCVCCKQGKGLVCCAK